MPAIPSWLLEPLWDQFAALLPDRPVYHPAHPLGCHKPRIARPDHLRKTGSGPAVRLLLCLDRRLRLRCHHDPGAPRRVDQGRDLRQAEADRAGVL